MRFILKLYVQPLAPCADPCLCLKDVSFGASDNYFEVVRDGRIENFAFVQGEDVDGEVIKEGIGDEEIDCIAYLLACDQLFIPPWGSNQSFCPCHPRGEGVRSEYSPSLPLFRSSCTHTGRVERLSRPRAYRQAG